MPDPFDAYTDAFKVTVTPFGANLSFQLREAHPTPHEAPKLETLGTVRMSVEHLKLMAVMIRNQIRRSEEQTGITFQVPTNVLTQLGIPPEDWTAFWNR